jgi:hypothetical protein
VTTLDISVNDVQLRLGKRLARMSSAAAGFLVQLNRTEANVKVLIEHFLNGAVALFGTGGSLAVTGALRFRLLFTTGNVPGSIDHLQLSVNSGAGTSPLVRESNHVNWPKI